MFFVATAPLAQDGRVNLSPKGLRDSFAILDELTVAYLDLGGSGAETMAHLRENGRITLMWCAFSGPPNIVRIHGRGEPVFRDDPRFAAFIGQFGPSMTTRTDVRAVIVVHAERISDTCGYAVPLMDYQQDRALHTQHFARKDDDTFADYCETKEHVGMSLDGLPGLPLPLPPRPVIA